MFRTLVVATMPLLMSASLFAAEKAGEHGDGHGSPGVTDFDPMTYVWQLILFGVLFAVLYFFVWPHVLGGLQAREEKMRGDLKQAEDAAREATAKAEELEVRLREAHQEAQKLIDEARGEAQRAAASVKAAADAEIARTKERAESDIRVAKEQAVAELYEQTAVLATQVAGRILQREISVEDQRQLIDESLGQLKQQAERN
ncbi:F0F1 ATP synthase subunit B [Mucisphaera calidilacus]|uniref:ATP synthase subunit b n=1 Tax=Mucisphaera calidilacus TaxID=2527982 RepID=A0A518BZ49_9BACT|nr:F0F1 ATP synthase subunit B [Mucisphaera calidilacus]QDU72247.1 ATP synthase subunit b [Mucisphaera calidilacus]